MPKERMFRRDSTINPNPDGANQSGIETAAQISMDDMTGQPVWSDDSSAGTPATEEVSV